MHLKKKKTYSTPIIEIHGIDKCISIVMASETNPPDPGGPPGAAAPQQEQSALQDNPFDENNLK